MSFAPDNHARAEASSSRNQSEHQPSIEDALEEDDDVNLLSTDPIESDLHTRPYVKIDSRCPH